MTNNKMAKKPPLFCKKRRCSLFAWLEITNRCNMQCLYCYTDSQPNVRDELSLAKIKEILSDLKELNVKTVIIGGGDPTMRSDLNHILEYGAGKLKLGMYLVTNGVNISESLIRTLSRYKIPVQYSIDSINAKIYKKIRGKDLLPLALKNLERLIKQNVVVVPATVLTKITKNSAKELALFALKKGIQNIHVGEFIPSGRGRLHKEIFLPNINNILLDLYEIQKDNFPFISIDIVEQYIFPIIFELKREYFCSTTHGLSLEVISDGSLSLCRNIRDHRFKSKYNIKNKSLLSIYDQLREDYEKFEISVDEIKECRNCKYAYICGGGCRALVYFYYSPRHLRLKSHPYCNSYKLLIKKIYQDYRSGILDEYMDFLKRTIPKEERGFKKFF